MRRERHREGLYGSSQVARILGIDVRTLYRKLVNKEIPEPMRNHANNYRIWTEADVQKVREALKK
jgi:DNA-binding transcriptional MerR regulator